MTTEFDIEMTQVAFDLIDEFGTPATFRTVTKTYDRATLRTAESGATNNVRKISPPFPYDKRFSDGVTVVEGRLLSFVAAKDLVFTPVPGMLVTFDTEEWRITNVGIIRSGDDRAAYELELAR